MVFKNLSPERKARTYPALKLVERPCGFDYLIWTEGIVHPFETGKQRPRSDPFRDL